MKSFKLIVGIGVLGGLGFYAYRRYKRYKWDKSCTENGGMVTKSGSSCDFLNCNKKKYPCNIYG